MFKTIVVPIDGSELASRAVPVGSWLAEGFDAELHLVTMTFAADAADAEEALRRAALHARGAPTRSDVIHHSFAGPGIVDVARTDGDALLCLSTRGSSGLHALLLGSVSDEVVRQVDGPVVLVGPACGPIPTDAPRLLVCIDGSDTSDRILPIAASWALELHMEVELVLVADAHTLTSFRTTTEAVVADAAEILRDAGVRCTARIEMSTTPARAIVQVADEVQASVIALATHGAGGLFAETLGHVVTEVVRHAPVPVVVLPVRDDG